MKSGHTHLTKLKKSFFALFCIFFQHASPDNAYRSSGHPQVILKYLYYLGSEESQKVFNSYDTLNQAIKRKAVGPLFFKGV